MSWLRMVFMIHGTSLERTRLRILSAVLFSLLVTAAETEWKLTDYSLTSLPFTLVGLALSIFLGFRNNAAYDRWWEARKLWGGIVNNTRTFAREAELYLGEDPERVRTLVRRTIGWTHATRHHLRGEDASDTTSEFIDLEEAVAADCSTNAPVAILNGTAALLREDWKAGRIDVYALTQMERTMATLTDLLGGCERILKTPIPWPYSILLHRLVAFYCFALPFGIAQDVGWATPVITLLVAYAMFGLDEIGEDIERPFDYDPNSLPLTAISNTIHRNLAEQIGDPVPAAAKPDGDTLT